MLQKIIIQNKKIDIFEIVQTIKDINRLYSSYEISFKGKNYLLDFYKVFYIWKLNPEKNQLEYEIIGNEIS